MRGEASARQPRGFFISTEVRPAFVTSEFWLTLTGAVALGIFAYASDALGVRWGMGFATAVLVAFVLSRGYREGGIRAGFGERPTRFNGAGTRDRPSILPLGRFFRARRGTFFGDFSRVLVPS